MLNMNPDEGECLEPVGRPVELRLDEETQYEQERRGHEDQERSDHGAS